jgi:glutathione peroxidase
MRFLLPTKLWCYLPMMDKVSVKRGDMCAMYQFLTQNLKWIRRFRCSFSKYLINENGELEKKCLKRLPTDASVIDWIKHSFKIYNKKSDFHL